MVGEIFLDMIRHLLAQAEINWVYGRVPLLVMPSDDVLQGVLPQTQEQCLRNCILECTKRKDISSGRLMHTLVTSSDLETSCVADQLIRFFASCGTLLEANLVFCNLKQLNVYVWHALMSTHAQHGHFDRVLALCHQMYYEGINPNKFIFPIVSKACGSLSNLELGELNHAMVTEFAFESDVVVGTSLIDMYVKFKQLQEAQRVFDHLKVRNVVSWASMIDGHAEHGDGIVALKLYETMCGARLKPDKVVFLCVLKACSKEGAIGEGLLIHNQIIKAELDSDVTLGNTLVDMYAKCKELRSAHKLFESLTDPTEVSWGALITGYAQSGQGELVLELYEAMDAAFSLNDMILPCILKACANSENLVKGKEIHNKMVKCMIEYDVVVGSSLVDMYAKCGSLEEALEVFEQLPTRNLVSWGAMIGGYMQQGKGLLALEFFKDMQQEGIEPDNGVFIFALKACASIGALKLGRLVHQLIVESRLIVDVVITGALVDMYAKCGSTEDAQEFLVKSFKQNVFLWGALIAGHAQHGDWRLAQKCVENMQQEGVEPNQTIYTSVLSACSHAGETEKGRRLLKSMSECSSVKPNFENLTCMVDLLGSSGKLEEAVHLLETMPDAADATGWTSLMTACKTYGNVSLGQNCYQQVSKLEPNGAGSALMSSIYANADMMKDLDGVRQSQVSDGSWKKPGIAWIEANNIVQEFIVGDTTHFQSPVININLKRLSRVLRNEGYVPAPEGVSDKMNAVCRLSEANRHDIENSFLTTV